MPRSGAFIFEEAHSLAKQLAFVPVETARRQLTAIRKLLGEIREDQLYEWTEIVWRITQFRIADQSARGTLTVVGQSLRHDLCELALRLSARAPEVFGSAWTLRQLVREWRVSERTIHRWRKIGLPSCWMRRSMSASSSRVLAMRRVDTAAFALRHPQMLARATRMTRITPTLRTAILRRAGEFSAQGERRISIAARAIASEMGVSTETVRVLLAKHPSASHGRLAGRAPPNPRHEKIALAAWRRGMGLAEISRRLDRSRASADRLLHRVRAQVLINYAPALSPAEVEIPRTFLREDAREVILAQAAVGVNLYGAQPMRDAHAWLSLRLGDASDIAGARSTDHAVDAARLMAIRFLHWSAQRSSQEIPSGRPSEKILDRIETDLRWARLLLRSLMAKAMPMIVTRAKIWCGGLIEQLPAHTLKEILVFSAQSLQSIVRESDPQRIASGRVRVDRAVALAVERRLISLDVPKLGAAKILRRQIPMRDPLDQVFPWQRSTDAVSVRVARITGGELGRELWWMRLGWSGQMPMTLEQISHERGMPVSVIARRLAAALSMRKK